jgi:hypothetical protein
MIVRELRSKLFQIQDQDAEVRVIAEGVDIELNVLELHESEQGKVHLVAVDEDTIQFEQDKDACPGCGCVSGDGITAGCTHEFGCGRAMFLQENAYLAKS